LLKAVAVFVIALALTGLWFLLKSLGLPSELAPDVIAQWVSARGMAAPLLLMVIMMIAVVVGPIPTLPVSAASGLAFGMAGGTLVASLGALAGALIALAISRCIAREPVRRKLGDNPVFREDASQRALFWGVFVTRLVPLFSFALISYAAGLTAIQIWRYALATWLGMLPMTLVFAGLGHSFPLHPAATAAAGTLLLLIMVVTPYWLHRFHGERIQRWLGK